MRDASFALAILASLFLAAGIVAGIRMLRKPDSSPPTKRNLERSSKAAMVIVIAFGLSAVAAVMALGGRFGS
ncbi:hypothetical protein H8M03_10260 [Sphingomonas sabuli]|uniref:Uncharacterized protein n=1 Tax=Sphingomonas sabuli TaxID=2764186 RepID=A0A7G9L189_9SPHN|nr:hypothetical protein [Sphingomonas sabuli]QNM82388.1 hypothetical protein H8M03_10260 [Sphingomonas sabuli]